MVSPHTLQLGLIHLSGCTCRPGRTGPQHGEHWTRSPLVGSAPAVGGGGERGHGRSAERRSSSEALQEDEHVHPPPHG